MKTTLPFVIAALLIVFSCTSPKKESEKIDSVKTNSETSSQNESAYSPTATPYAAEPASIFTYFEQTFTEDERESAVTQDLMEMLRQYEDGKYLTIKNEYSVSYQEEVDANEFMNVHESIRKTWFYDSLNNLRCFTMDYQYRVGNEGFSTTSTIYLSAGDSLVAAYEDGDESIQVASKTRIRLVAKRCPDCGTSTNAAMSDTYQVIPLDDSILRKISKDFFKDNDPNFSWLTQLKVNREGDDYTITQEEPGVKNAPRTVAYTINRYLFDTYIKKP